jgi:hypothetical protein
VNCVLEQQRLGLLRPVSCNNGGGGGGAIKSQGVKNGGGGGKTTGPQGPGAPVCAFV